jgi:hypothetical protein
LEYINRLSSSDYGEPMNIKTIWATLSLGIMAVFSSLGLVIFPPSDSPLPAYFSPSVAVPLEEDAMVPAPVVAPPPVAVPSVPAPVVTEEAPKAVVPPPSVPVQKPKEKAVVVHKHKHPKKRVVVKSLPECTPLNILFVRCK